MNAHRLLALSLIMVALAVGGCSKAPPPDYPCQKFVLYQERKVNVDALKIVVQTTKVPVHIDLGQVNVDPRSLREAPEKIQALDLAQFSACQAVYAVPAGPERVDAAKRWAAALTGLIYALAGPRGPTFSIRLDGQNDSVRATHARLDLGYIAADRPSQYRLRLSAINETDRLRAGGSESGVEWKWESGAAVDEVDTGGSSVLLLTIDKPWPGTEKTAVVRLVPEGSPNGTAAITVHYTAVASAVAVESNELEQQSGAGKDFSKPYYACVSSPSPGNYAVIPASIVTWLTGDRACNSYATCDQRVDTGGARACLVFTLQGHDEEDPKTRSSTGHIRASFGLTASTPSLSAITL